MICRRKQLSLFLGVLLLGLACQRGVAVTWFPFGPDGGSARSFAADPLDHAHLYLGAANGWIYQSRDGGKKWYRLARVGNRDDLVIDNIQVDPLNPKHLVVGAWALTDGGIYISNDGGATWTSQPEMRGQSVRALTFAQSNPKIFVAGTLEGVFRSSDSGAHWERISPRENGEIHEIESLAVDPTDPNIIYAGTWHLPWKTGDGGKNWESIKQGIIDDSDVFSIVVDPKQPNVVYLSACSGIYRSEDGGTQFVKAPGIPSSARRTRVLRQDPNQLDTVFAGTTEGLYRTFDAGEDWIETTSPDVIVNDVYVDPADSKHVLLATDRRGVLASEDGGDSFLPSNTGFSARQITAFTGDIQHPATVYVGVVNDKDWGGVFVSHTGGLSWSHLSDGLGGHDVFSLGQAPDGTIMAGTEHGIFRLKDFVWQRIGEDKSAGSATGPAAPAAPTVKATHKVAMRSTAAKATHKAAIRSTATKLRKAPQPPSAIASAREKGFDGSVYGFALAGGTMFAATSQGMRQSITSGAMWDVVAELATGEWRWVAATKAYVAAAGLDSVEMSMDSGSTWQAIRLPPQVTQVSALSVDGLGGIWIGDRNGVYVSSDKGARWQALTNLYVRNVNSIYYDQQAERMLVTMNGPRTEAFAVEVRSRQVTTWDTGWNLRFVRPVGDHLVAATLFDGIVVQPRMVALPEIGATKAEN